MKELEVKLANIAGYMPYGLKVYDENEKTMFTVKGIEFDTELFNAQEDENDWLNIRYFKPILRPLSDIWRAITHNGKEVVPIVKCAKKIFKSPRWKVYEEIQSMGLGPYLEIEKVPDKLLLCFWYDLGQFRIHIEGHKAEMHCEQIKLLDYLNELKIDYRELIDSGLAIDANTLKPNPYD
jgi:hypothetical protein